MSEFEDMKSLINLLSTYIETEKIPIVHQKEDLLSLFRNYEKTFSLKGIDGFLSLMHRERDHRPTKVFLADCPNLPHCLECYIEVTQEGIWNPNATFCTHGKQIKPNVRNKIFDEQDRVNRLLKTCLICGKIKDKMNFPVLNIHPCEVCIDCIRVNYDVRTKKNLCPHCKKEYEDESELTIRVIVENDTDPNILTEIYLTPCPGCNENKDSRTFLQICKNHCKVCTTCNKSLVDNKVDICKINNCGSKISALVFG